jgi:5-methylcytosine-specific restriction endonuclease McrA
MLTETQNEILQHYLSESITTKDLAMAFKITPRTIQRLVNKANVTDTIQNRMKIAWLTSEAIKEHVKLCKDNSKIRKYGKYRKSLSPSTRLHVLERDNFICQFCGSGKEAKLHIDHIDEDFDNNDLDNLRVLCMQCNLGRNTWHNKIKKVI